MTTIDTDPRAERIACLRESMKRHAVQACIIYGKDPHQSEISPAHWNDRKWISGFSGSAGTVVVTMTKAALWTDSRYIEQARQELRGLEMETFQIGIPDAMDIPAFLKEELSAGDCVAVNGKVVALATLRKLEKKLESAGIRIAVDHDFVSDLWQHRPALPAKSIAIHPVEYAGLSVDEKLDRLRDRMRAENAEYCVLVVLEAIAWLFNIRGGDIDYTPVAAAYALISLQDATLCIDRRKASANVASVLGQAGVRIQDYGRFGDLLANLPEDGRVLYDPKKISCTLHKTLPADCGKVEATGVVDGLKAIKNDTEIENIRATMVRDGVAMCRFLRWLEDSMGEGGVTEMSAAGKLHSLRADQPGFRGPSFPMIAAYGAHAAWPHYHATDDSDCELEKSGLFLLDSGGQYSGGTTDITRTVALGDLSENMRRDYTLVLKGLINLTQQRFEAGAKGCNLDTLARTALWERGLDFKHATGHGVGCYLNVHEGPCGISARNRERLKPGNVLTIEPGLYRNGRYGLRIENLVLVVADGETDDGKFYRFETLTLCPIDTNAVDPELLSVRDVDWLNQYHRRVCETLSPGLDSDDREWLCAHTRPLQYH